MSGTERERDQEEVQADSPAGPLALALGSDRKDLSSLNFSLGSVHIHWG